MLSISASAYPDSKPHYAILDGLRGVASLVVVAFHLFEAHAASHADQIINHGYLAVDFFFVLSGFVIGYAYDDRWGRMTYRDFFKRRLIRLHPMVVMGMLIGAAAFYFGAGGPYEMIAGVPVGRMLLILLLGCLMIPVPPSMDIRGWSETYPLDGPAWSLFFEYIANICYALVLRRLSKLLLGALAVVAACFTVRLAVTQGDMIGGWALDGEQLGVGFTRLAYPFIAGLLLSRVGKLIRLRGAFWLCSLCVVAVLAVPHLGTDRRRVHHRPLPAGRSGRRGRQSHGPGVEKGLRFLGRHLLSAVYHALSVRLYLYCVGDRYPSRMARSTGVRRAGLRRQHPAGVVVPASVRRTGARVAQTPLHAAQTGAGIIVPHGRLQPESRFRVVSSISPSVSPAPRTLPRSGRADSRTFPESGWRCGW